MAILEKEVWVDAIGYVKYYESLGYEIPRSIDNQGRIRIKQGTKILVKTEDIPRRSNMKIFTKVCDDCGKHIPNQSMSTIYDKRKSDDKDRCLKCSRIKVSETLKNNVKYENSLEYYALENNIEYLLDEFSRNNKRRTTEIPYGTDDVYLWNCFDCKREYPMKICLRTSPQNRCGCPYCGKKRVDIYNCLITTHPEVATMLKNKDRGYKITYGSGKYEDFICGNCGHEQSKRVNSVVRQGLSCSNCSDGISYPEKFLLSLLSQLELDFEKEKFFEWSRQIIKEGQLLGDKRYDFYIESLNCIIETHGEQHYVKKEKSRGRSFKEEVKNDILKESIAKENNITHYIVIDCRNSELDYIKSKIIQSKLSELLDLKNIDWLKCHEFASNTLMKTACELWRDGIQSTIKISEILNLSYNTVARYLKKGEVIGWCNYDPKEAMKKNKNREAFKKSVVQLSFDYELISEWDSIAEVNQKLKIPTTNISKSCKGKRKSAGGYRWMYKEDYDQYIKEQNKELTLT
ncbi:zinc-ribbon domain-containing protein [Metabacillus sp. Hm71]|uniref:zinc-ribbon domain-containing protein n=1 Tax=Metabacillus sp. Hm71 TaxID=3450743 RepID=UPI003F43FCE8